MGIQLKKELLIVIAMAYCHSVVLVVLLMVGMEYHDGNESSRSLLALAAPVVEQEKCAILFFGLPRSYESLVLPSIKQNVLEPNSQCDVYAHAVIRPQEEAGRSGNGGDIDPNAIYLLKQAVQQISHAHGSEMSVTIRTETEDDFWEKMKETIQKFRTTRDDNGNLVYFPWNKKQYEFPSTMDNVVRQWYSIESVWKLMERTARTKRVTYNRVAMMRSDVFYATPVDIYETDKTTLDLDNTRTVIPRFALYPVNDRMVYGPFSSVKIWATERFRRIDQHVRSIEPGVGIHSETFMDQSILPAIQQGGSNIVLNPDICFFRVRADMTVWSSDCERDQQVPGGITRGIQHVNKVKLVEEMTNLSCTKSKLRPGVMQLTCSKVNETTQ